MTDFHRSLDTALDRAVAPTDDLRSRLLDLVDALATQRSAFVYADDERRVIVSRLRAVLRDDTAEESA